MLVRTAHALSVHLARNRTLQVSHVKHAQLVLLESMVCATSAQPGPSRRHHKDLVCLAHGQKLARMPVIMGPARYALMERPPMRLALHALNANQVTLGLLDCATRAHPEQARTNRLEPLAWRVRSVALVLKVYVMRALMARRRPSCDTSASRVQLDMQDDKGSACNVRVAAPRIQTVLSVYTVSLGTPDRAVCVLNVHLEHSQM